MLLSIKKIMDGMLLTLNKNIVFHHTTLFSSLLGIPTAKHLKFNDITLWPGLQAPS